MVAGANQSETERPALANRRLSLWKKIGLALVPWPIAIVLPCIFWWPILTGAGFVGSDTYVYYFPLKQFYAESLAQGEIWLWNPRIGHGVPSLAESQTGVFYPFYLLAYRLFDLDTAYSFVFLVHYVLGYVFTYWFVRALGLRRLSSLLSALIFIYGWFPPRSCLEWAMVTGAWMPMVALGAYHWMTTGKLRWAWLMAVSHAAQLLAGHFHLAFITELFVLLLALLVNIPGHRWRQSAARRLTVPVFLISGLLLAALQLVPTWELRQRSQRAETGFAADLEYGCLPFGYLTQMVTPWSTYPIAEELVARYPRANMIEAHFYIGLLPLGLVAGLVFFRHGSRPVWPWVVILVVGIFLASGVAIPILRHLPGFGYFRAPGRYALMSQLALAVLAAECADRIFMRRVWAANAIVAAIFVLTTWDFWWVARHVQYAWLVRPPLISEVPQSPVCQMLGPKDRVLAPAGNLLALSGAACVPPYLGMGPAEYYKLWNWDKNVFAGEMEARPEIVTLLRDVGVTHILTEAPLPDGWPVELLYRGYDPFLHRSLIRDPAQPYNFYRLDPPVEVAYVRTADGDRIPGSMATITQYHPHSIEVKVSSPSAGRLVLTELMYPGWQATIDGNPAETLPDPLFRVMQVPAGEHVVRWTYMPRSFYVGLGVSGSALLLMGVGSLAVILSRR